MINNRKVRIMTKLAIYEKGEGKEDLKINNYFRRDYLRNNFLKTFVAVTIGFVLIAGMRVVYKLEYIIQNAINLDYALIIKQLVGLYVLLLTVYSMAGLVHGMLKLAGSRHRFSKYFNMLKKLRTIYNEENSSAKRRKQ